MESLSRKEFKTYAAQGTLVPVYRELPADLETPVSVYLKLRGQGASFLLESVEKAEQLGRYSFLGFNPQRQIIARGGTVTLLDNGRDKGRAHEVRLQEGQDPLHVVADELGRYTPIAPLPVQDLCLRSACSQRTLRQQRFLRSYRGFHYTATAPPQ